MKNNIFFLLTSIIPLIGLLMAFYFVKKIQNQKISKDKVKEINQAIREGSIAFLKKESKIIAIFVLIVFFLIFLLLDLKIAISFLLGAFLSFFSGNIGMRIATLANGRVAEKLEKDIRGGLNIAFRSGSVMGLIVVGFGILGIALLYWLFGDPKIIYGFGFGASAIALFARVGGGIYTKAADVGADLVGKVESDIPEDDPRNAAVIADNVGDNVGDVAGMATRLSSLITSEIMLAMSPAWAQIYLKVMLKLL